MSLKHGILGLLNYSSMTGYELDKRFKKSLNFFWKSNRSQVYRELNTMKKLDWVKSETVYQTEKPNKKIYTITNKGKEEFIKWLSAGALDEELKIKSTILVKTYFASNVSTQKNIEYLSDYKEKCQSELNKLADLDSLFSNNELFEKNKKDWVYWKATANYGKSYFKMCIQWAEDTIKELEVI